MLEQGYGQNAIIGEPLISVKNGFENGNEETINKEFCKTIDTCKKNFIDEVKNNDSSVEINKINDECLRKIFKYLTITDKIKFERVCKRWQRVSKSCWSNYKKFDSYFLFLQLSDLISEDNVKEYFPSAFLSVLARAGLSLKEVELNFCHLQKHNWSYLLKHFIEFTGNVEKFSLFDSNKRDIDNNRYLDQTLTGIFMKNQNLKYLFMHRNMDGSCLLSLPFQSIESIDLHLQAAHANKDYATEVFSKLKNLTSCSIKSSYEILELILKEISFDQNKIIYLNLKYEDEMHQFNQPDFSTYFAVMKNLKTIKFYDLKLSETDLQSLPLNSIEEVALFYNTGPWEPFTKNYFSNTFKELLHSISYFMNLKEIEIYGYHLVTDDFCERLRYCEKLKSIKLNNCNKLTDISILHISLLPQLEKLYINSSDKLTDAILIYLFNIKYLEIANITNITVDGVLNFLKNTENLEYLYFYNCKLQCKRDDILYAISCNKNISKAKVTVFFNV